VMAIGLMGAPLFQQYLEPALKPLRYAGGPDRLFLEEGGWHRFGRRLRVQAEMIAETTSDSLHPALGSFLLAAVRTGGNAALLVGGLILVTLSVQLWIEPTLAYHFNRLSWIAPAANLIIVPFSSLVLAAGFIAALAPGATPLISCAGWLSSQLASVAGWISGLPGAWQRCPTPSLYWPLAAISLLFLWCFLQWRRLWIPCIVPVALLLWLSYGWAPAEWSAGRSGIRWRKHAFAQRVIPHVLRFTFLDVGQGDSIVVRFPDSRAWLIDAGGTWQAHRWEQNGSAFDVGESVVSRYLWWNWITRLNRLILSHTHEDHAGGMPAILRNFAVGRFENGENQTDSDLVELLEAAGEQRVSRRVIRAGNEEVLGEVRIRMLHPPADGTRRTQNENSVVLHISFRRFKALLPGDLEKLGERELVDGTWDIGSHLLKVAHHGSRYATLDPLLKRVRPRWAVISSGRNNPFGYPARDTISRLLHQGARPLLTQDLGAITFETDGYHYILAADAGGVLESGLLPEMGAIPPAK